MLVWITRHSSGCTPQDIQLSLPIIPLECIYSYAMSTLLQCTVLLFEEDNQHNQLVIVNIYCIISKYNIVNDVQLSCCYRAV